MSDFFTSSYFFTILIVILYSSVLSAMVGSIIYMARLVSMAGAISHAILAGVGLATWLGISIWFGSFFAAIISCLILAFITVYNPKYLETTNNILWGMGMSLGILFTSFAQGYQQNISTFLFGNIVLVSEWDGYVILGINIFIFCAFILLYRQLLLIWFSPIFAKVQNLHEYFLWFLSLFIVSLGVISLVKTMGIALALVLISVPNHIARLLFKSQIGVLLLSICICFFAMLIGLICSYNLGTPAGATTAIVCFLFYGLVFFIRKFRFK